MNAEWNYWVCTYAQTASQHRQNMYSLFCIIIILGLQNYTFWLVQIVLIFKNNELMSRRVKIDGINKYWHNIYFQWNYMLQLCLSAIQIQQNGYA